MTRRSTRTMTVLSQASLTTTPWRMRFGMSAPLALRAARRGARSPRMVLMRAMSRRTWRTRAVFSSWPLARWKRRLKISLPSVSSSFGQLVGGVGAQIGGLHRLHGEPSSPGRVDEAGARSAAWPPASSKASRAIVVRHAVELEHDAARLHPADPEFGRALAAAHAHFGRLRATPARRGRCGSRRGRCGGCGA